MKTITYDPAVYKVVPLEADDDMVGDACEAGNLFRVDACRAIEAAIAAVPDQLPGVVEHSGEPVLYQRRMRPTWVEEGKGWTPWADCSKESHDETVKLGTYQDWEYQARKLYTHPAPSQPDFQPQELSVELQRCHRYFQATTTQPSAKQIQWLIEEETREAVDSYEQRWVKDCKRIAELEEQIASQPSAEAIVQAALEAAALWIDDCEEAGETISFSTVSASIRALDKRQIIESCKEKS